MAADFGKLNVVPLDDRALVDVFIELVQHEVAQDSISFDFAGLGVGDFLVRYFIDRQSD